MCDLAQQQINRLVDKVEQWPHPSRERRPGGDTVAQVSQEAEDDDGRVQHVDFGLEGERWTSVRVCGPNP